MNYTAAYAGHIAGTLLSESLAAQFLPFVPDIPTPACSYVRYSSLEDVRPQELGFRQLEFTPTVVSKIR